MEDIDLVVCHWKMFFRHESFTFVNIHFEGHSPTGLLDSPLVKRHEKIPAYYSSREFELCRPVLTVHL